MAIHYTQQIETEKVTFNIPVELKEKVQKLKSELHIPLSAIYNEAIAEYINKKENEKWEKAVDTALKDSNYLSQAREVSLDTGDIYEY